MPTPEQRSALLEKINKEKSQISRAVIKAGDAYNVGLLADKYKIPYLETKYPGIQFKIDGNEIVMSRDGGETFGSVSADPKYKLSNAAGVASPFVIGVGSGVLGGYGAGPGGALSLSGLSAVKLQDAREAIEKQIDPDVLKKYGMEKQNELQRMSDVAMAGITDVAAGQAWGKLGEGIGALANQPSVKQGLTGITDGIAKAARKAGTISDEFIKPRQDLAKQAIGGSLVDKARLRSTSGAGERIQNVLQAKVDADDAAIDSLWNRARYESELKLKEFSKMVGETRAKLISNRPAKFDISSMGSSRPLDEGAINKATADLVKNKSGYFFDFSKPYNNFLDELTKATNATKEGDKVYTAIKGDIERALSTSRRSGISKNTLIKSGNEDLALDAVSGPDLYSVRQYLGERIAEATNAGDHTLKRTLTQFKNTVDNRLAHQDIPGAKYAQQALKKQRISYQKLPDAVRQSVLARPSKGVERVVDPETAFENILNLKSTDRNLVGKIIQKTPGAADELAQDVQAKAVLQGAIQPKPKLNATPETLKEAQFTTKKQLEKAIESGYIPNTKAVKSITKGVGEETIDLPSKTSLNYLTSQKGAGLADIIGAERYQNILAPIKEYSDIGVLSQSAKQSISPTGQQVVTDAMTDIGTAKEPLLRIAGNVAEKAYRPVMRGVANVTSGVGNVADEIGSARTFSNAPFLNLSVNAIRGGGNEGLDIATNEKKRFSLADLLGGF